MSYTRIDEGRGVYQEHEFSSLADAIAKRPMAPMSRIMAGDRRVAECAQGPWSWVDVSATNEELCIIDRVQSPLRTRLAEVLGQPRATGSQLVLSVKRLKVEADGTGAALSEIAGLLGLDAWAPDEVVEAARTKLERYAAVERVFAILPNRILATVDGRAGPTLTSAPLPEGRGGDGVAVAGDGTALRAALQQALEALEPIASRPMGRRLGDARYAAGGGLLNGAEVLAAAKALKHGRAALEGEG